MLESLGSHSTLKARVRLSQTSLLFAGSSHYCPSPNAFGMSLVTWPNGSYIGLWAGGPPCCFFFPVPEPWVPRPCAFCKGGWGCCLYHFVCHAARPASHLRRPSPALYHLLVLPPIAFLAHRTLPRPIALDSGTDSAALSFRGRGIRRHAGTHSPAHHRTRGGNAVHGDASAETTHGPRAFAEEKAGRRAPKVSVRRRHFAHAVLAGAFLRFQRVDDSQARRKTAVYASQSREARLGDFSRTMGLEQLSFLSVGRSRANTSE